MTRRWFFYESLEAPGVTVCLNPEVSHHVWRVLRHRPHDAVELCDGQGRKARAIIREYRQGRVVLEIMQVWQEPREAINTVLLIPWARSDRMDLVVRQAVELGVGELWFFASERSQYSVHGTQKEKRLKRYHKIALEALCQCGGAWLPIVCSEDSLEDVWVRLEERPPNAVNEIRLLACEAEPRENLLALHDRYPLAHRIVAAVGPEGGWTDGERQAFQARGFIPVSLGKHVLRFETACTAVLAAVEVLWKQAFHK
ncbi:RsmE family RNA methyltransferase [Desulfosoma caldarium]|uniref:Ribosomal RNA small subunit methyltransferase E n=1 Tax=Desulfosoma caldarium TaxID=610254 RepID=A0A3N1UVQ6_9BACT|nr:RsmE family RNA methyltransferase [Desulfosoma caldarium]ROQ93499.1 16S rRNA (uracil1498-N3)-methyltransferase [Desulfosoma caldarium]